MDWLLKEIGSRLFFLREETDWLLKDKMQVLLPVRVHRSIAGSFI